MTANSWSHAIRGFTLVELLVALAIGALLLGILGNVLGGLSTTARKILVESGDQEERANSARIVNSFLKLAIPPNPADPQSAFKGSKDEMAFRATPPDSMVPFGVSQVRMYLDRETSGGTSLLIDVVSAPSARGGRRLELKRHVLYRNVAEADFHYDDWTDGETRRSDHWRDNARLPSLIGLAIRTEGTSEPISIQVMPRRNIGSNCRLDQVGLRCGS